MTRKDFEMIAEIIRNVPQQQQEDARRYIAWQFAERLRGVNPRFDGERFLKACNV